MMAVLPAVLQQSIDGDKISGSIGGNVLYSETAIGLPRKRRRFSNRVDKLPITMSIDLDVFNQFETFFKDDLRDGSIDFTMVHPVRGGTVNASFDNNGYKFRSIGRRTYQVSFTLLVTE